MLTLSLSDFCRVTHNITYSALVVSGMKNVYSRTNTRISAQTDKAEMSTYILSTSLRRARNKMAAMAYQ